MLSVDIKIERGVDGDSQHWLSVADGIILSA